VRGGRGDTDRDNARRKISTHPRVDEFARHKDGRQPILGRELGDELLICLCERIYGDNERVDALLACVVDRRHDVGGRPHVEQLGFDARERCRFLELFPLGGLRDEIKGQQVPSLWLLDKRAWPNFPVRLIAKAACRLKFCAKITMARIYCHSFVIGRPVNGEAPQQGRQSMLG